MFLLFLVTVVLSVSVNSDCACENSPIPRTTAGRVGNDRPTCWPRLIGKWKRTSCGFAKRCPRPWKTTKQLIPTPQRTMKDETSNCLIVRNDMGDTPFCDFPLGFQSCELKVIYSVSCRSRSFPLACLERTASFPSAALSFHQLPFHSVNSIWISITVFIPTAHLVDSRLSLSHYSHTLLAGH
jgi:hypothetical protein